MFLIIHETIIIKTSIFINLQIRENIKNYDTGIFKTADNLISCQQFFLISVVIKMDLPNGIKLHNSF